MLFFFVGDMLKEFTDVVDERGSLRCNFLFCFRSSFAISSRTVFSFSRVA
jgi:hypothetical protein